MLRKFPSPFHRGRGGRGYKGGTVLKYLTMILRVIALVWEHFYYYRARGEEGEEGEEGKREEGGRERGGKREGGGEEGSFGKEKLERRNFFFGWTFV